MPMMAPQMNWHVNQYARLQVHGKPSQKAGTHDHDANRTDRPRDHSGAETGQIPVLDLVGELRMSKGENMGEISFWERMWPWLCHPLRTAAAAIAFRYVENNPDLEIHFSQRQTCVCVPNEGCSSCPA